MRVWHGGRRWRFGVIAGLIGGWLGCLPASGGGLFEWNTLPPIPDGHGFAGVYAGVVADGAGREALLVAGGANFPDGMPWQGGKKIYHREIYLLDLRKEGGKWSKLVPEWPEPVAYGMSVSLPELGGVLFMGGRQIAESGAGERAIESVRLVRRAGDSLQIEELPGLPEGRTDGVAALVGSRVIVIAGATNKGGDPAAGLRVLQSALALDTAVPRAEWKWERLPWPESAPGVAARGRMHAVGGVRGGVFYLFGGRDFAAESVPDDQARERIDGLDFLRDCHALDMGVRKWRRIADLPQGLSAAPSTAVPVGAAHLAVLGGVTVPFLREQIAARPELNGQGTAHPGFPAEILVYDTLTDTWAPAGSLPKSVEADHESNPAGSTWAPVTTPAVPWNGGVILPTGEVKPGIRSPQVIEGRQPVDRSGSRQGTPDSRLGGDERRETRDERRTLEHGRIQ